MFFDYLFGFDGFASFVSLHLSFRDNLFVKLPPPRHCSTRGMYWNVILYFIWSLL